MYLVGELVPLLQWRPHFHTLVEPKVKSSHLSVGCYPPRSLPCQAWPWLEGPKLKLRCMQCSWLTCPLCHRGEGSGHSRDSCCPIKERSSSVSPTSGIPGPSSSLEAYVSSFLCNHKSLLSGLILLCFFSPLCFQESRSGDTNSCVEEIIRVRRFFFLFTNLTNWLD